eukprot:520059-Pyramimonas_sp.AAC.1
MPYPCLLVPQMLPTLLPLLGVPVVHPLGDRPLEVRVSPLALELLWEVPLAQLDVLRVAVDVGQQHFALGVDDLQLAPQ